MIQPPSLVLFSLLQSNLIITEPEDNKEWPCFISFMPEDPNNCVCLYDTQANPDGREMRTGENVEHPGIQIRLRANEHLDGWTKINAIYKYIQTISRMRFDVGNYIYELQNVSSGSVIPLGLEAQSQKRRHLFVCNLSLSLLEDNVLPVLEDFHTLVNVTLPNNVN